eukprot:sb/3463179/
MTRSLIDMFLVCQLSHRAEAYVSAEQTDSVAWQKMNILPKKKWHVRTKENVARVLKDEEEARIAGEAEKQRQPDMKTQSTLNQPNISTCFQRLLTKLAMKKKQQMIKIQKEWEIKMGALKPLGFGSAETAEEKPWYQRAPGEQPPSTAKRKRGYISNSIDLLDPISDMKRRKVDYSVPLPTAPETVYYEADFHDKVLQFKEERQKYGKVVSKDKKPEKLKEKLKKKEKKKHKKKKKRRHSSSDEGPSSSKKSVAKLREERLKREEAERSRTNQLLGIEKTKDKLDFSSKPFMKQKYNSQFNPEFKMNILPKKKWHVRTKENVARVLKDEEEARIADEAEKQRVLKAESEARLSLLRTQSAARYENTVYTQPAEHINLFSTTANKTGNEEKAADDKNAQKEWEIKMGALKPLGFGSAETAEEKPWYQRAPGEQPPSTAKRKRGYISNSIDLLDPISDMKRRKVDYSVPLPTVPETVYYEADFHDKVLQFKEERQKYGKVVSKDKKPEKLNEKLKKKEKKKHKKKKKRRHSTSSDEGPSSSKKSVAKLREERLKREEAERSRTNQLLGIEKTKDKLDFRSKPFMKQKYNSQFNPKFVKSNYKRRR